jgi:hypothetical protein
MKFEHAGAVFPYTVADTESGPEIHICDNGTVKLQFTDYRLQIVRIVFHDVLGVKYQSSALDISGLADDCAIEVIDSTWLHEICRLENVIPTSYRHFIIGFNERGMVLEILFSKISEEQ